jgi:hypothetical protein
MSNNVGFLLDHAVGGRKFIIAHPSRGNLIISAIGSTVVLTDLDDVFNYL